MVQHIRIGNNIQAPWRVKPVDLLAGGQARVNPTRVLSSPLNSTEGEEVTKDPPGKTYDYSFDWGCWGYSADTMAVD